MSVIVIGAGASGLACARDLKRRGAGVRVLEARDRIGGRIWTLRGFTPDPFELGAMMVHGQRAIVVDVAREAGLALDHPNWGGPGETFVAVDGELVRRRDIDHWWWGAEREIADLDGPDVPLDRFLTELGWPDRRRAVSEELFAQFWCADPKLLSAEGVARVENAWASGEDNLIVREGYDRVAAFLARGLDVELGAVVEEVSWGPGRADVRLAGGRVVRGEAAVVSVPPPLVAAGRLRFDPPLDGRKASAVTAIPLGPVLRIVARLGDEAPSTGSLIEVGSLGGFWRVNAATVVVWIGGPSASRWSGTDPVDVVLHARSAFPWLERSRIADVRAADWGTDPYSLGGYSYPRAGALDAPAAWAEPAARTLFFCGEGTCGDLHPATVHGAIESGLRAAREVSDALAGSRVESPGSGP